ncbi:hypothetical protein CGCSCA5_v000331 [Colletotrichum siamense]|nr:uncharacterized protein CGCS363_v000391 [Colletotrichum siamense]KAI8186145.1 hypothetical protein K4K51_010727 [Colletotrichum sp. SAR 10_75]KAI8233687.1 hypothetical protein K4K55_005119 [Colletotrichum sp. SAR 10_96]KAI8265458.1 hypothetical protein K4K58_011279 [Colletotrichum sp. SAR11_239]KAJ5004296.1 hypothetical protein K4K48_010130 [Colletotrichum sp. SAR 10_66]KAJ5008933.1 hypothetical protein K4K57_009659 [Colletotrichum sp. SAR 10_99]
MGFFDFDNGSVLSHKSSHSRRHSSHHKSSKSKHRSRSNSSSRSKSNKRHSAPSIVGSIFGGGDDHYRKHNSSRSSFFGIPNASRSSSGFFGFGGRSPSYYKRSPRSGFLHKTMKQVKRLWRDLVYYAKKHPYKVLALVIMPLITGGFLTALLARFGLRLPPGIERMIGIGAKAAQGDSVGLVGEAMRMATTGLGGAGARGGSVHVERGYDGGMSWERRSVEREGGWSDGIVNGIAKMFV